MSQADMPQVDKPQVDMPQVDMPQVDMPQVPIGEVLDALQVLANRHRRPAATDRPPPRPDDIVPAGEWDEPVALEPAPRRWRLGSMALIIVSAAVLAVLLVGALSLSRHMFHREPAPAGPTATAVDADTTPVLVRMPGADGSADLPTIQKALDDCDVEAARNPDGLYFVILPLLSPVKNYQPWIAASVGEIGTSVILLRSKDALDGLRDGSLTLYRGAYTFSIIDAATEATHAWSEAVGVARLGKTGAAGITGFRVRFGFADFVGDTPSNFRFPRQKGVCYWVSALLRQ
ncbi:hypothetical protein RA307_18470 [Xanthobacteraceae bacterium Astr-EGSB]|uniref:hypothetical protein n=1 Tax=Astrobacterium formosum TaxID=3069710 RepID=UPI0027B47933|nr:hypothetical protein [Xanthobacteraceae bacterium Astr-EGSB]